MHAAVSQSTLCDMQEPDEQVWQDFAQIAADPPTKRSSCPRCERPQSVCFCADIEPVESMNSHLVVLQHPNELKRCLRTTKILELSIPAGHYHLFNGKRFSARKLPRLHQLLQERPSIVVYPGPGAEPLAARAADRSGPFNVILVDGTWSQARVLYNSNPFLQALPCVKLELSVPSQYVIRTQPTEACLSTVEAAATVLAAFEAQPAIYQRLTRPLKTICDYQLGKGAVQHQSKEFLIANGLYTKPLNKRLRRRLQQQPQPDLTGLVHLLDR